MRLTDELTAVFVREDRINNIKTIRRSWAQYSDKRSTEEIKFPRDKSLHVLCDRLRKMEESNKYEHLTPIYYVEYFNPTTGEIIYENNHYECQMRSLMYVPAKERQASRSREILMIDLKGIVVKEFANGFDAGKYLINEGITDSISPRATAHSVYRACRIGSLYKGYEFKYKEAN
ncbi:hypothetical protein [Bacillus wiedmannii]|uniref:hypothetical protein n=1 Tax=Bacillus wiedmannii TaxID=1890302 RepID=UPI000BF1749E|nr:hypothetical protein [Bacillus wiedmannii]PEO38313.1 hypothetical protein CN555_13985 [Bacillus wiedmannii]